MQAPIDGTEPMADRREERPQNGFDLTRVDCFSPSFTEFYRVLLGFTGFYLILLGFTGFY